MDILEEAHRASVTKTISEIAEGLQGTLGQRLTAYAVGVRDPKAIGKYARGQIDPRDETARRMRELFRITRILGEETPETIRAWMIGSNPLLEDKAPIELLHDENTQPVSRSAGFESSSAFRAVYEAGREFAHAA